jgi:hypothetical protein
MRLTALLAAVWLAGCGSGGGSGPAGNGAVPKFVSEPDCPAPSNMVAEFAPAPLDATYMLVLHMGDPGTPELAGEIANRVTWAVGDVTGFYPADPAGTQRGYRDAGPPTSASAFQLACDGAGFLINTFQFSHAVPIAGGGPNVAIARDLSSTPPVFRDANSVLSIEADVDLHSVTYQSPPITDGTAQVSLFYYIQDSTTQVNISHVVGLFDGRAPGVSGSMVEGLANDTQVHFFSSPLLPVDGSGMPVKYVRPGASSSLARTGSAWGQRLHFAAEIPYDAFAQMLARLKAGPLPGISPRPEDYRLTSFGVIGEVSPGTGSEHNVLIGASVFGLRASGG